MRASFHPILRLVPAMLIAALAGCLDSPPSEDPPSADMAVDSGSTDGCTAAAEICNGADDDCDGVTDEGFNLQEDEANCGTCGTDCNALSNADGLCVAGECAVTACDEGFIDCTADSGCETVCVPLGEEPLVCNGIDEDCDCVADEAVPVEDDINNCGGCNIECVTRFNADPGCVQGSCVIAMCDDGFFNPDGLIETGCRCNHPTAVTDLPMPVAPLPETIRVSYPGDGGDGVIVAVTNDGDGLDINYLGVGASGRPVGELQTVQLERIPEARLIDVRSLGGGRHAVIWTSGGDLRVRRLGDAASTILFDRCNLDGNQCQFTVVDGEVVAVRLEVLQDEEREHTVIMTSQGNALGGFQERRDDIALLGFACLSVDGCLTIYRDAGDLHTASGAQTPLQAEAVADFAPVIATGDAYIAAWARSNEDEESVTAVLDARGRTERGPHLLRGADANNRRLRTDGEALYLFSTDNDGATQFVRLRDDGTQASDQATLSVAVDGFTGPGAVYNATTGRIQSLDDTIIIDGIPWPDALGERMSVIGAIDGDDAILVFDGQNGDFVVRVNDAGEIGPAELLYTHRGGPQPVHLARVDETLFALRLEPNALVWATHTDATPVRIQRTRVGEVDAEPTVMVAALMPWGAGVLTALAAADPDGAQGHLQVLHVPGPDALPEQLPITLTDGGHHASPRLAGPGPGQGAVLITNWIIPDESGTELRLHPIDGDGVMGAHDVVGRLTTRGLHAAVYSPISGRTFVALADDLRGGGCARGLGVQVFDESLTPLGAPPVGLDLRERVEDVEVLGERCITGVVAVPNQGGGLTVALEVGDANFWMVNFSRDGLPMGEARRWNSGSPRHDLALWPRRQGARAYWHRRDGVLRQAHLGCE